MAFPRTLLPLLGLLAASPALADAPNGETIFRQRCQSCHTTTGKPSALAPSLAGVVGRKAAATPFAYSAALRQSGLVWTRANLDRFLTAPAKLVPGTRMVISLSDPAQRRAVLDYLAKAQR